MKPQNLIHILTGFVCIGLLPQAQAVNPPPDGGYPGGNTAEGQAALLSRTTGGYNTAVGLLSLRSLTIGSFNTAIGAGTLLANFADDNTATGAAALLSNTIGTGNTANGAFALVSNMEGFSNTAVGDGALQENTTGGDNVAIGDSAGFNQTSGSGNVYIGTAMTGVPGENDHTYIRNINTTSVSGGGADFVTVDLTTGLLGHLSSSQRYKENIKPMENTSETLYRLKPVTYRYKKEIDQSQSLDYGLIAEEVAQVDPNLAIRDRNGQIESVRYSAVNAMLLNEFLKEHKRVEDQARELRDQRTTIGELKENVATQTRIIAQQQKAMAAVTAQLKEQAAQIQKVSAQVELNGPAPQQVMSTP